MNNNVAFFLPVRAGSQRVKNKNTKPFAGIKGGLLENKLRQLSTMKNVKEVILSTNDELSIEIAEAIKPSFKKLRVLRRPDCLCDSSTNLKDLIRYVHGITKCDHILWGHVTTPLVPGAMYDAAVKCYREALKNGYDSLVGVSPFRNFLLDAEGRMVNNTTGLEWPRTQDLTPLYEINHTMFIAPRKLYAEGRRSGSHPKLYELDKIRSHDVDWNDDFAIAEALYKYLRKSGEVV